MVNVHVLAPRRETLRLLSFLAVGAGGTVVDFVGLTLLKLLGWPSLPANTLSYAAGIVNNFVWNSRWTFADVPRGAWPRQFVQFAVVSGVGLALNDALVLALEAPFGTLLHHPAWGYVPAKLLATALVAGWGFFANRAWTFRRAG